MYKINQAIAREYFFFKKKKKSRVLRAGQSNLVPIILLVVHVHFVMEEVLRWSTDDTLAACSTVEIKFPVLEPIIWAITGKILVQINESFI